MKIIEGGEMNLFMIRSSDERAVINHVKVNGYHNAAIFRRFTPTEETKAYGLTEEKYYITFIATYGHEWDGKYNTQHQFTIEVSKEEGNELYKEITRTKTFKQ